jgi:hypothetical protein
MASKIAVGLTRPVTTPHRSCPIQIAALVAPSWSLLRVTAGASDEACTTGGSHDSHRRWRPVPSNSRRGPAYETAGLWPHRAHDVQPSHAGRGLRARADRLLGREMAQVGLMVGLAAELRDMNIRVNAISPVAASRVLRRSAPELQPELVAPGVAFLASSACDMSGIVLHGGRPLFGRPLGAKRWGGSGTTPATPEDISARWRQVAGLAPPASPATSALLG